MVYVGGVGGGFSLSDGNDAKNNLQKTYRGVAQLG